MPNRDRAVKRIEHLEGVIQGKRFQVALSFPGERRKYVQEVADSLCRHFSPGKVFYDKYFEAELARLDLDTYLQEIYHDHSELIAVFLCAEYEKKEWCGLEWRAIRDLIKKRKSSDIMPMRFDSTEIPGLFSIDGYCDISAKTSQEAADLIIQRYTVNRGSSAGPNEARVGRRVVQNLPFRSLGNLFKGREDVLKELERGLSGGGAAAITQVQAVHGLGGIGKTRAAVEYAWRGLSENRYGAALFVLADSPDALRSNLAALVKESVRVDSWQKDTEGIF
jgi:hypothetical protein